MLGTCPQVIPFATRVSLFTALRDLDRDKQRVGAGGYGGPTLRFTVRRDSLVEDSFQAFSDAASAPRGGARADLFKARFQV